MLKTQFKLRLPLISFAPLRHANKEKTGLASVLCLQRIFSYIMGNLHFSSTSKQCKPCISLTRLNLPKTNPLHAEDYVSATRWHHRPPQSQVDWTVSTWF